MPIRPPPIAGPPYEDVAARAERLAKLFTQKKSATGELLPGWVPPPSGETDAGRALIRAFDRMARHVIDRINRIPDRSLLAFLNLIGVEPTPPRPARVPLTFKLVETGNAEPTIPAGTRVGAVPAEGDKREIVFETAPELATTKARLTAVLVRQPDGDRWADRTQVATSPSAGSWPAFGGEQSVEHSFFVSVDDLQGLPAATQVTVVLTFASQAEVRAWQGLHDTSTRPALADDPYYLTRTWEPPLVRWSYWNGSRWTSLALTTSADDTKWRLTCSLPADMVARSAGGRTARWLRATLTAWPKDPIPAVRGLEVSALVSRAEVPPDAALAVGRPVDLSMDFFPLGDRPRLSDAFHVASAEVLSRPGATVTLTVAKSFQQAHPLKATDAPTLRWEVSTSSGWAKVLDDTTPTKTDTVFNNDVLRTMSFTLPSNVAAMEVQGKRSHWLRIRLVGGGFGKGFHVPTGGTTLADDGYRPPILERVTLGYQQTPRVTAPTSVTYDDFVFTDRTGRTGFTPFTRSRDTQPALYLGFDRPFTPRDVILYVQVSPLSIEEARQEVVGSSAPMKLAWEYSISEGWAPLGVEDETRSFTRSGLLRFAGPERFESRVELDRARYWLRARLVEGTAVMSRLGHVLTNTVWGTHSATLTAEVLGTSDGGASQVFTLSHRPVLEGQRIEVREPELPPAAESAELERLEGPEAIQLSGEPPRPQEIWVRWSEVPDFHASGPRDRHYVLDRRTGEVRFGDGRYGLTPPRGVRNVRASIYRTGGGADGNRPVGAVSQLKTTVAYVDAVTNHEAAMGGSEQESVESIQERGTRQLRHGGRAVTVEDFEDLARQAFPSLARVKALAPVFDPIKIADDLTLPASMNVVVLIVPRSPEHPPSPSPGLLQDVDAYLRQRCSPAVPLRVVAPDWVAVGTDITFVPTSLEGLEAVRARVQQAITAFLHPLTGGFDGTGWELGQLPKESDIYRRVEEVPGVELVRMVTLKLTLPTPERAPRALVYSGAHTLRIAQPQGTP